MKMIRTLRNLSNGMVMKMGQITANPYKKLNISWINLRLLKNQSKRSIYRQRFLNGFVLFSNVAEFLYGVDEIFVKGIYDFKAVNVPKIIDCGGHIGLSAIYFKHQYPSASIVVFEPDKKNFELLQKNIQSQGYENVQLRGEAVWIENTELTFISKASMSSKIGESRESNSVKVKACRLKELLTEELDLLKMDIEGAEYEVLKDIRDRLYLIKNIFIEYHGTFAKQNELLDMLQWIVEAGFTYYIKEAYEVYKHPFNKDGVKKNQYDVQLNIFAFRL